MNDSNPMPDRDPRTEASHSDVAESRPVTDDSAANVSVAIDSRDLFRGRSEIWIKHEDTMYRLRRTGAGKLYLSK